MDTTKMSAIEFAGKAGLHYTTVLRLIHSGKIAARERTPEERCKWEVSQDQMDLAIRIKEDWLACRHFDGKRGRRKKGPAEEVEILS